MFAVALSFFVGVFHGLARWLGWLTIVGLASGAAGANVILVARGVAIGAVLEIPNALFSMFTRYRTRTMLMTTVTGIGGIIGILVAVVAGFGVVPVKTEVLIMLKLGGFKGRKTVTTLATPR